jgi:hypothetical protein
MYKASAGVLLPTSIIGSLLRPGAGELHRPPKRAPYDICQPHVSSVTRI